MYDQNHKLTRAGMEQIIKGGGTVLHKGAIIGRVEALPSEADLAAGDEDAERRALAGLEEQQRALDAQRDRLSRAAADRAKAAKQREAQQAAEQQQGGEEEEKFAGRPLAAYADKSDDEILAMEHVGPATLKDIRHAEKKAVAKK
jgi:hypothetical protein